MGIGLATGAPDTHPAPTSRGRQPENSLPPVGYPTGVLFFQGPVFFQSFIKITLHTEDYHMNHATYYRNDTDFAWRFSHLRSGQPAASVRSLPGGNSECPAHTGPLSEHPSTGLRGGQLRQPRKPKH
ncbi:hypothetical protein CU663_18405, partial [Pseudomonas syringae pv. actinidifoliorum]|nr:hypothetical protein [Pseudomonas syringae pv. actinidifoliorum]